ncbi:molybdopterin-dependent oxidoreductase [Rhodocytophaga aerolata]|uniref:Molybdopterin-dependent oxidoreductase n=1 Tax=Rhodocytophaga aerolata TaxID=455078 RepID=A0ABT8R3T8_9BACT|nr:nitrate reductase [Rhodocytophaga aerolata]MDO1446748.1 molybdopterin-dependent oxidoreductase [Rhodocytophaga aerolata]
MSLIKQKTYKTTCSYCGVGCGMVVHKDNKGNLKVEGDPEHPGSQGMLCSKGMNLHYTAMDTSDRLLHPEMRWNRNSPLQRVSWDTGLDRAAAVFKTLINKHGPDSVGFYVSGQCLTEEYYIVNKLIKGFIGSNNIDTNSRLCMSSAVVAYKMALGEDSVPISYEDIELADCFLIAGANPAWCHPIIFRRLEAHKAKNPDVKIIVVDPRKTQTTSIADLHFQINPGTDIVLYNAIGRGLIERDKIDADFIANHTEGFNSYRQMVMGRTIKEAAKICGVKADDIYWAVEYIGRAEGFISMWAMGLNQSVIGVNKNFSLINLSLITGKIGKPGSGPFSLTGQPNAMGGREVGGLSTMLAAHRDLKNPQHRKEVADYWGVPAVPEKPGYTATEMFEALRDGRMKAIWIICTNPLVSLPNSQVVEEALQNAKFVVVQDISNRADTVKYADLVLPAAAWAEKTGTMTNSERRVSYLNKIIDPPGEALPDVEILCRFAKKMGFGNSFNYEDVSQIYDEHAGLTKGTRIDVSGLSHARLKEKGTFQWPVPTSDSPGTPRLFTDHQFYTTNKRATIYTVPDENLSEPPTEDYPLILTTGRIRDQWHTMTKTGKVYKLKQHIDRPFLEIHPADAKVRNIAEGNPVVISNRYGQVQVNAKITDTIKKGVVFLPMHWGKILNQSKGRANNLTTPLIDPVSKEPDFKFSAVQVEKYIKTKQKILVIGAGAAASRFVSAYREWNVQDEIHVFSREVIPFYNRVMLPDYISGAMPWEKLIKLRREEQEKLHVHLHNGISIQFIDRENKTVLDTEGNKHSYDLLLLATGSSASLPKDLNTDLEGIFTMRTRQDADLLKAYTEAGSHVVIIGGGLLGLELAASLRELSRNVTIIQRVSQLMNRQLDKIASDLLHEEMTDRGVDIYYNDQVKYFTGKDKIGGVRLASGRTIECDAVVFAIGTTPTIDLAKGAGLQINRGIVVNEYLQTSDPDIFAMGEIAEHQGMLYGITAAAEEQADVICKYLNGDWLSYYKGSLSMNILKMEGLKLCSIGMIEVPANRKDYEEVIFIDKSKRYYKKCIIHQDRLVGAILMGDKTEFIEFKELIANQTELSEKRLQLLRSGKSRRDAAVGKLICSCNNVGEGNIQKVVQDGCAQLTDVCKATGAGMGCGSCKPEVKAIIEKSLVASQ